MDGGSTGRWIRGMARMTFGIVNVRTGAVVQTLPLPGAYGGIHDSPDGKTAYVAGEPAAPVPRRVRRSRMAAMRSMSSPIRRGADAASSSPRSRSRRRPAVPRSDSRAPGSVGPRG